MLLRLAHFSYNTMDLDVDIKVFLDKGFTVDMIYENIKNPRIKKSWLSHFSEAHSLYILKNEGCIDVEFVDQGSSIKSDSYICDIVNTNRETRIHVKTGNIEKSNNFWRKLGLKDSDSDTFLFVPVITGNIIQLHLHFDPNVIFNKKLDAHGIYSMAFLSHNAELEQIRLARKGLEVTELDTMILGDYRMRVFFVMGNQNEIVEIYDVASRDYSIKDDFQNC